MNYEIKILVVDDELPTRLLIRSVLKKIGFHNVVLADNGLTGLQAFSSDNFDLILSDWNMPVMDGLEFFRAFKKKKRLKKIPFFLLTAEMNKDKIMEAVKCGIDQYIMKPIKPADLENRLRQVLDINPPVK